MMFPFQAEDDYLLISSLNDFLFCERRAALHLIEGLWQENRHTVAGTIDHQRVHSARNEYRSTVRHIRGMKLISHQLRITGVADMVEFHVEPSPTELGVSERVFPIEYKRGKKRRWDNDEVQLCAQALCLEEMLQTSVPRGAIYHVKSRARREVEIDQPLRELTIDTARRLHAMLAAGKTPLPIYKKRVCGQCSLFELCLPAAPRPIATASRYLEQLIAAEDDQK